MSQDREPDAITTRLNRSGTKNNIQIEAMDSGLQDMSDALIGTTALEVVAGAYAGCADMTVGGMLDTSSADPPDKLRVDFCNPRHTPGGYIHSSCAVQSVPLTWFRV